LPERPASVSPRASVTRGGRFPRVVLHLRSHHTGDPGPVRCLPGAGAEVRGHLQGLRQREGLSEEPQGPAAPRPPAPSQRLHRADEAAGLRQRLQVQPVLQRPRGAAVLT